jgi:hypothetical protein
MGLKIGYKVSKVVEKTDYVEKKIRQFVEKEFDLLSDQLPAYISKKAGFTKVDGGNGLYGLNFRSRVLLVKDGVLYEPYAFLNMIETDEGMQVKFIEEDDIDYFSENTKIYGQTINFGVENVFEYHWDNGKFDAVSFIFDYGSNRDFLMIASYHIEPLYKNIKMFYDDAKYLVE